MTRPVPGLTLDQQHSDVLAVMLIYGEARNQADAAMCGPLCVALNRAYKNRPYPLAIDEDPLRLKSVILYPYAFSCFNEKDPNRAKMLTAWKDDPASWGACSIVADLVLAGICGDPTQMASHYCTKKLWGMEFKATLPGEPPVRSKDWYGADEIAMGRTIKTAELGDHVYARAPGKFL